MTYAIKVTEIRNGSRTFDKKDELKAQGFKWTSAPSVGYSQAWVKEVEDIAEACKIVKLLAEMGFGSDFGTLVGKDFYSWTDVRDMFPDVYDKAREAGLTEDRKVLRDFKAEHNLP